jgi:hypothetical protein
MHNDPKAIGGDRAGYGVMVLGVVGLLLIISEDALAYSCMGVQSTPIDFDRIKKAIDPKQAMGESERNLATIGAIYQWKMNHGDTDGAACAAFQMIQHYRVASQKYAIIAAAADQKGDLDVVTLAAMKAYANVADPKGFQVQKTSDGQVSYKFTDKRTGMLVSGLIVTPDKLASTAMGFAQAGFDKTLLAAAEPEITRRAVQGDGAVSRKPKTMLDMPRVPLLDIPAERPQQPMNCFTMEMGGSMSTTNCN